MKDLQLDDGGVPVEGQINRTVSRGGSSSCRGRRWRFRCRVGLWRRGNPRSSNRHPGNCAAALSTRGRGQSR